MLRLLRRQPLDLAEQLLRLLRSGSVRVKELLRGDVQVVADIEKARHGRQRPLVFDLVDIALALPKRKAHVPCGNAHRLHIKGLCKEAEEQHKQLLTELQHDADEARKMAGAAKIALDDAQRQLAEAEADVEEKCAEAEARPTPASEAQKILDGEVAQTMELLQKSIAARNELYAAGIIFGKYQNAVALSSFYEYLMSGRCEKLEGTNGAYNLYESEVRANRVIEQLDTVIDSLDQIKANQYMMYSAMCSMKQELTQLNDTMNSALSAIYNIENSASDAVIQLEGISQIGTTIAKNSDVIAHNTAAPAYYAEKNAELTNAMGYLVALR